ncbi:acetylornithine deacetylase [Primorskyibacter flagellatus]|uniref:Acetylornithine deacetylase n=1 Tax=Primorskyibacter flagellatus TaxID=1387277 RepID=A0A917EEC3_9RHOB|nr:acetylornithine deacetylase [Primorskyibacter flagellatus]GGE29366.1 acetylornithine deacetylase [Primorskyibacter flagellatus]
MTGSIDLIRDLVAFPTVSRDSNRDLLTYVTRWLSRHGVKSEIIWNDTRTKGNLWATIGPDDQPGVILSGHTDVVPVDGQPWQSDPFVTREAGGRLYGRGTADMKGFIGTGLAAVPDLVMRRLKAPLHIALSYDEEVGCTGVTSLLDRLAELPVKPALCIVGEPTSMQIATGHKCAGMYRITLTGAAAHSARAPEGVNAIAAAARLVLFVDDLAAEMRRDAEPDPDYEFPGATLSVNTMDGGTALNIVPATCTLGLDIRAPADLTLDTLMTRIRTFIGSVLLPDMLRRHPGCAVGIEEIVRVHGLTTDRTDPAVRFLASLLPQHSPVKVDFGTEAGAFTHRAGITSLVCGPGSMAQGHQPDEFIELNQIRELETFLGRLADRLEQRPVHDRL